mmetsp:Transcript_24071/g.67156  ORF Transcript_24071/g.67156 Transcript_24071/m.67156 type:complete len:289 (+) Transcript_24071:293-1159(+)
MAMARGQPRSAHGRRHFDHHGMVLLRVPHAAADVGAVGTGPAHGGTARDVGRPHPGRLLHRVHQPLHALRIQPGDGEARERLQPGELAQQQRRAGLANAGARAHRDAGHGLVRRRLRVAGPLLHHAVRAHQRAVVAAGIRVGRVLELHGPLHLPFQSVGLRGRGAASRWIPHVRSDRLLVRRRQPPRLPAGLAGPVGAVASRGEQREVADGGHGQSGQWRRSAAAAATTAGAGRCWRRELHHRLSTLSAMRMRQQPDVSGAWCARKHHVHVEAKRKQSSVLHHIVIRM